MEDINDWAASKTGSGRLPASGFTLLELLIVLVVIAVLLAVAIPAYNGIQDRARLKSAAQSLVGDLDYLRTDAARRDHGSRVSLVFNRLDAGQWCYGITAGDDCDCTISDPNAALACALPFGGSKRMRVVRSDDFRSRVLLGSPSFPSNTGGRPATYFSAVRGLSQAGTVAFTAADRTIEVQLTALGRIVICSPSAMGYPECE
jgi:type IV fimbrial biogenesis protein FimT